MNELEFEVQEIKLNCGANIKVIGVGGCGSNMINDMIKKSQFTKSVELIVANTDIQDLEKSESEHKLQLGKNITGGRGAGAKPEVGLASAQEAESEIKRALDGANLVFLATGLGGGTGTGAAPFIARIAKELGALVIGLATMPFEYERRMKKATKGLEEFKKECDSVILIHNGKLRDVATDETLANDGYHMADTVLLDSVESMLTILLTTGDSNVDFADVQTIMTFRGLAQIGSGYGRGEDAVNEAFIAAFHSPLLESEGRDLTKARGILPFVRYGKGITFRALDRALGEHLGQFDEDIECIHGRVCDPSLADDEAHVIMMFTGFEDDNAAEEKQEILRQQAEAAKLITRDELMRTANSDIIGAKDYKSINYEEPPYKRYGQD